MIRSRVVSSALGGASLLISFACQVPLASAGRIAVSDDTWVREDSAASNRNGDGFMNARTDEDADDNDVVLLGFDLSSVNAPVAGASLNLTWYRTDGTSNRSLDFYGLLESASTETTWSEATVVYNDAPGLLPDGMDPTAETAAAHTPADIQDLDVANLVFLGNQAYPAGGQAEGTLSTFSSAALDAFLNADTNDRATILILRDINTSGNQARFTQKEATSTATGVVTGPEGFAAAYLDNVPMVPEPGSLALACLAGAAVIRRGRRR